MEEPNIHIVKVLPASIETVWDAFTNPASLMQWKSPETMTTADAKVDLRVGGSYSITMAGGEAGPSGKVTVGGIYEVVEKPTRLVFSWQWNGEGEKTTVTIRFRKLSDMETEMDFVHDGFLTTESRDNHEKGWKSTFNKLDTFISNS